MRLSKLSGLFFSKSLTNTNPVLQQHRYDIVVKLRFLKITALFLLLLPYSIFLITWTNIYVNLIGNLLLISSFVFYIKSYKDDAETVSFRLFDIICFSIFTFYIIYATGNAGFANQKDDIYLRNNIIFSNLMFDKWPIQSPSVDSEFNMLSYYIGYFIPISYFYKYFTFLDVNLLIFGWTYLVLFIGLLFLFVCFKNNVAILLVLLPNGIFWLIDRGINGQEIPLKFFTQINVLAHGPQQNIPALMAIGLLFAELKKEKSEWIIFIIFSTFLWSPFTCFGLMLVTIYYYKKIDIFSVYNIVSFVLGMIILLFYIGRNTDFYYGVNNMFENPTMSFKYLFFICTDILLLPVFFSKVLKVNFGKFFWYLVLLLILIPFIRLGKYNDFVTKTSVPIFILYYGILIKNILNFKPYLYLPLIALYSISSFYQLLNPFLNEPNGINRVHELKGGTLMSVHTDPDIINQFYSSKKSFFNTYIVKKN